MILKFLLFNILNLFQAPITLLVNLKEITVKDYKKDDYDYYDSYYMRRDTYEDNMKTMKSLGEFMKHEIDFDSMYLGLNTKALNGKLKSF